MGLYNMIHGTNPAAPLVLMLLERAGMAFGRFRDAWVEKNDAGELRLVVYTRCGGGNREEYEGMFEEMRKHPLYMGDKDDDFDCTYASLFFKVPTDAQEKIEKLAKDSNIPLPEGWTLASVAQDTVNMGECWEKAIEAIKEARDE